VGGGFPLVAALAPASSLVTGYDGAAFAGPVFALQLLRHRIG